MDNSEPSVLVERCSLHRLSDEVLDKLVESLVTQTDFFMSRSALLSAFGSKIHAATVRVMYKTLEVLDDNRELTTTRSKPLELVLRNPDKYGSVVQILVITDPCSNALLEQAQQRTAGTGSWSRCHSAPDLFSPLDFQNLSHLLKHLPNLRELIWQSSFSPPDALCETLVSVSPRLMKVKIIPHPVRLPNAFRPKWDAPSLSSLSSLAITTLHLFWISQDGAKALTTFLSALPEDNTLTDVSFDFVWLDDTLCETFSNHAKGVKKLSIGTSGTRLTDMGVISLMEGCRELRSFRFSCVQGRLTSNLWEKVENLPKKLHTFEILTPETGIHSWSANHLKSIQFLDIGRIQHLSLCRVPSPPKVFDGRVEVSHTIDEAASLQLLPNELLAKITRAQFLVKLECDWWSWRPEDIKCLSESNHSLQTIRLAFASSFSKLLTMTASFSSFTCLEHFYVSVDMSHTPGYLPPSIVLEREEHVQTPTPAQTPMSRRMSLSSVSEHDANFIGGVVQDKVDPFLPTSLVVKRFARKIPRLVLIEWYGHIARGTWFIARSSTTGKLGCNLSVDYQPPKLYLAETKKILREQEITACVTDCNTFVAFKRSGGSRSAGETEVPSNSTESSKANNPPHIQPLSLPRQSTTSTPLASPAQGPISPPSSAASSSFDISASDLDESTSPARRLSRVEVVAEETNPNTIPVQENDRKSPVVAKSSKRRGNFRRRREDNQNSSIRKAKHSE